MTTPSAPGPGAAVVAPLASPTHPSERSWLSVGLWRVLLLSLALGSAVYLAFAAAGLDSAYAPGVAGTLGGDLNERDSAGRTVIKRLEPGSPLEQAGARVGDRLVPDHKSDRWRYLRTDEVVQATLIQNDVSRRVTLRPMPNPQALTQPSMQQAQTLTRFVTHCLALLLGVLIVWRQAHDRPMRALAGVSVLHTRLAAASGAPSHADDEWTGPDGRRHGRHFGTRAVAFVAPGKRCDDNVWPGSACAWGLSSRPLVSSSCWAGWACWSCSPQWRRRSGRSSSCRSQAWASRCCAIG